MSGTDRCPWCGNHADYVAYHDREWGRPLADDARLLEKLCLEGFQAGLSWLTILRKRERFREVFHGFDPPRVAAMGVQDVERLLTDAGIVRHRGKIESTINNAAAALRIIEESGSLAAYLWAFAPTGAAPAPAALVDLPTRTTESAACSVDLKRRGWSFVGPTTVYAFMQSVGMVNDHLSSCAFRSEVEAERSAFSIPRR